MSFLFVKMRSLLYLPYSCAIKKTIIPVMGLKCASCCIHPFFNTAVGHKRNKCNHSTSGNVGQLGRDKLAAMEDSRIPHTADTYQGRTSG